MSTAKNQSVQTQIPPDNIPAPAFSVGVSRVRWEPVPNSDWGFVMGMQYLWAEHLACWQWQYYVVFDTDSPSCQWTQFDWGWQDDLESLPTSDSQQSASCRGGDKL